MVRGAGAIVRSPEALLGGYTVLPANDTETAAG